MRKDQDGTSKPIPAKKEPRAARFLEGKKLTLHDACNALRFSMADALRGDVSTRNANMVVGGTRELRRMVETGGRLTEPSAEGLRSLNINDTDKPDNEEPLSGDNTVTTLSEQLAELEAEERALAERKARLMQGK